MSLSGRDGSRSADAAVRDHIRRGEVPTADRVSRAAGRASAVLGAGGVDILRADLAGSVLGLGPLQDLLADERVTDILVNGDGSVWVDRGDGVRDTGRRAGDPTALRRLAVRLAGLAGQRLDASSPFVDGLLPGGLRLHALLPPLVDVGPHLSLRIPRRVTPSLTELVDLGSATTEVAGLLRAMVCERRAFLVSGGTGSGKTTLLGALLGEADPADRVVVVEDVRELAIAHPHVVRLQARAANVEGQGEVPLTMLVRQCLRMRPDRVVVGEVRGAEVRDLLLALNTGHRGGCGTVHANGAAEVVTRFEALGALGGMTPNAVRVQFATAIDTLVHLGRSPSGVRVVEEVARVRREGDDVCVDTLWSRPVPS